MRSPIQSPYKNKNINEEGGENSGGVLGGLQKWAWNFSDNSHDFGVEAKSIFHRVGAE
ncbi:MAG: hypothetical protein IPO07_05635 [Haliscomenobacter sp.]|nr:hypothetical protein [Haliscomenobacter sp.]